MKTRQPDWSRRNALKLAGAAAAVAIAPGASAAVARTPVTNKTSPAAKRTAKLFLTDAGSGENILFLHGWTCDSEDWSWQLPPFEGKYRVIAADLRGHGHSEVMPSGSYTPPDFVADVEALVEAKWADKKFIVIGHSMGGQIAARLAAKRPDLVKAVVSVDGSLGFSEDVAKVFRKAVHDMDTEDPGIAVPALFKLVYAPSTDPGFKSWHARRVKGMPVDVVREAFAPLFFGPDQIGIGEACAKFCRSIKVPFYHMCRDPAQADRMRPWFSHPKSRVDVWNHSGHWIMQDRKKDWIAAATAWINAL